LHITKRKFARMPNLAHGFVIGLSMCLCVSAAYARTEAHPEAPVYITHVTVIDTVSGGRATDRTVTILGDKISRIQSTDDHKLLAGAKVIDGRGKFLIPGLWDMHVHGSAWAPSFLTLAIANGVTGVRDMFGPANANEFRKELAAQHTVAPALYLASPIVDGDPPIWPGSIVARNASEARQVVDEQKRRGADFIKVYSRLSREAYFAILDEAKRRDIPVAGHVPSEVTALEATAAGQRTFEHLLGMPVACSSDGDKLQAQMLKEQTPTERKEILLKAARTYDSKKCERLAMELKRNGTWIVPTLVVHRSIATLNELNSHPDDRLRYFGPELQDSFRAKDDFRLKGYTAKDFDRERELFVFHKKLTGEMARWGVRVLAGTDTGNPYVFPGFSLHEELALLVDSGLTPLAALQAATWNAAQIMGATKTRGSIAKGKLADLVLLDADPLLDIHNTTRISAVVLQGHAFNRGELDELLGSVERAAKAVH